MRRKKSRLLFRFMGIFLAFSVLSLAICGFTTYANQNRIYRTQLMDHLKQISNYICRMMQEDEAEFVAFQNYFLAHGETMRIPADTSSWADAEAEFFRRFHETYPGRTLEVDMDYSELSDEIMELCAVYNYEYWMNLLLEAMDEFDIEYIYYFTPVDGDHMITYVLDIMPDTYVESGFRVDRVCAL